MTYSNGKGIVRRVLDGGAIVLSILLAFAIDAGWSEFQERREERTAIASLYADFRANRELVRSVISYHERAVQSFGALLSLREDEIHALPAEAIEQRISYIANPLTFDAVRGSLDALIHSGKLDILEDRELQEALTTFLNVLDDTAEDAYYLGQSSIAVWDEFARHGGPWRTKIQLTPEECARDVPHKYCYVNEGLKVLPVATPDDLLRLRNDPMVMGHARLDTMNAVYYSAELHEIAVQIEAVLELLENSLSSTDAES
jgi:hypothetical protein